MNYFYGKLQGNRKEITRRGSKVSGVRSSLQTWNVAIQTELALDKTGSPIFKVYELDLDSNERKLIVKGSIK